jgi:NADPH-dependent glutamate synthase beta subunit-like oxidoreductase
MKVASTGIRFCRNGISSGAWVRVRRAGTGDLENWRTTVPGVYAAGDLAIPKRQVAIAAASGVEAAMALNEDLVRDDTAVTERAQTRKNSRSLRDRAGSI